MRKKLGSPDFKNDSKMAEFFGYSRGLISQILTASKDSDKYPNFHLSSEFIATVLYKTGARFDEFFDIVEDPDYDPNNKYTKFFKND
jgi:hypothetical protein